MTHDVADHVTGPRGEAHRVPTDVLDAHRVGDTLATLDYWWLHLPGQGVIVVHADATPSDVADVKALEVLIPPPDEPSMDTFALGLITLADLPGVPSARKKWPWVTHELIVHTIDTTNGPVLHTTPMVWPLMQPHNVSAQFEVLDDDMARHLAHDVVVAIVHGMLPPECQAFVPERHKMMTLAPLYQLWQDTVNITAEHLRTGGSHHEALPDG